MRYATSDGRHKAHQRTARRWTFYVAGRRFARVGEAPGWCGDEKRRDRNAT
jgi:hypothetical protein